jgi:ATP-dependent DNA helicase DinG
VVPPAGDVAQALGAVTTALRGAEDRPGQQAMAAAVARSIDERRHLVVSAGTGTGKSLAYLVPVALSGRPTVVATATKALQDQIATKDLPLVSEGLASAGLSSDDAVSAGAGPMRPIRFAVLKGRSNYLCRQRARELGGAVEEPGLAAVALTSAPALELGRFGTQVRRLIDWAQSSSTGDRAELDFEPHPRAWASLSVTAQECPGAYRCPSGTICFAERARARAAEADIVVVNTHLYATDVASDGGVLPEHEVVVLDEAHAVEDVMTEALGIEITPGRLRGVAQSARGLTTPADASAVDGAAELADRLEATLVPLVGRRVLSDDERGDRSASDRTTSDATDDGLWSVLALARGRLDALAAALRRAEEVLDAQPDPDVAARRGRALLALGHLAGELATASAVGEDQVAWVESVGPSGRAPVLRVAPVEVGPVLAARLWPRVTAVLTSATVPPDLARRLGLPADTTDRLDVGSPFPFDRCALLYCAAHLPDPRRPEADQARHDELAALIAAAGGRTLALFTSWRAMHAAADALRPTLPFPILAQGDMPKARLLEEFSAAPEACLFATMSFWQGVDVPGPTLSLVTLDRLPFPRPDDPLLQARRDRAGTAAFRVVDLPRAATLLAQGAGRLIRGADDRGVVAVLDSRLATAGYRAQLLAALPPMARTTDHDRAVAFLEGISNPVAR